MEVVPTGQVVDSGFRYASPVVAKYLKLIKQKAIPFRAAKPGSSEEVEPGVTLEFLTPPQPYVTGTSSDPNNNSVVCRLTYGGTRFLFTGDMEEDEREWLERHGEASRLPATVLKVAHHGSHNGTDDVFLQRVQPAYAVISSGHEYGHPHKEALTALQEAGVKVLRTDELGTIHAVSDGTGLTIGAMTPGQPAPAAAGGGPVIGNRESQIYHRPNCGSLPSREKRVKFASESEAVRQGYRPHRSCVQ
jgi:competence protein ComEC